MTWDRGPLERKVIEAWDSLLVGRSCPVCWAKLTSYEVWHDMARAVDALRELHYPTDPPRVMPMIPTDYEDYEAHERYTIDPDAQYDSSELGL